ncbi:22215_t:CDS:2 [Entrophospora sp. SA101]|nr:22215_t:CDS:2 [Entrophospora sp. SA101]
MPLTKTSDSSNSDFILSDEIYSSDSDVDIIHIDAEVAIKQGKVGRVCSEKYSSHRRVPDSVYDEIKI